MITAEDVQAMVAAGGKHFLVAVDGNVLRNVRVTAVGEHDGAPALVGWLPDQTQTGPTAGEVQGYLPLSECGYYSSDPGDPPLPPFQIHFYGVGPDPIVMAAWSHRAGRAFGDSIEGALAALQAGNEVNPRDCTCEFAHCSSPDCRSVVPSFGAVSEAARHIPPKLRD